MDDLRGFQETLAALVAEGGTEAPRRICELCVVALPVTGAAITLMADADRQSLVWASDEVSARIDELQFRLAEGPCVEAFVSGRPVLIADITTTDEARWPMFAAAAARETPARGMYVWPLRAGAVRIGVLDFYRDRPGLLDADAVAGAELDGWAPGTGLERREVYQATGMVIAQLGLPPDAALARMRAHAFAHDLTLDEVAREIVARRLRLDPGRP